MMRRNVEFNLRNIRQPDAYPNKLDYLLYEFHETSYTLTSNFST